MFQWVTILKLAHSVGTHLAHMTHTVVCQVGLLFRLVEGAAVFCIVVDTAYVAEDLCFVV